MFASLTQALYTAKRHKARLLITLGLALALAGPTFVTSIGVAYAGGSAQSGDRPSGG